MAGRDGEADVPEMVIREEDVACGDFDEAFGRDASDHERTEVALPF